MVPAQQVRCCPPGPLPHFAGPLSPRGVQEPLSRGLCRPSELAVEELLDSSQSTLAVTARCLLPCSRQGPRGDLEPHTPGSCLPPGGKLEVREGRLRVPHDECGFQRDPGPVTGSQQGLVTPHCSGLCNNQHLWPRLPWEPAGILWAECLRRPPGLRVAAPGQVLRGPGDVPGAVVPTLEVPCGTLEVVAR